MQTLTVEPHELITSPAPEARRPRWASAFVLMGAGVVALALATAAVVNLDRKSPAPPTASETAAAATGVTAQSEGDITVLNLVYEAGQSSGWHSHRGIHAVAILSGSLTVIDEHCVVTVHGPDNPYIGGQRPHLIRNDNDAPVPMVVTYVNPAQPSTAHRAEVPGATPACAQS